MQACCNRVYGSDSLEGRTVAVEGLGSVGHNAVRQLHELGAKIVVSDIDSEKMEAIVEKFGVQKINSEVI